MQPLFSRKISELSWSYEKGTLFCLFITNWTEFLPDVFTNQRIFRPPEVFFQFSFKKNCWVEKRNALYAFSCLKISPLEVLDSEDQLNFRLISSRNMNLQWIMKGHYNSHSIFTNLCIGFLCIWNLQFILWIYYYTLWSRTIQVKVQFRCLFDMRT